MALNKVNISDTNIEQSEKFKSAETAIAKLFISARSDIGTVKNGPGNKIDRIGSGDELTTTSGYIVGKIKGLLDGKETKEGERGIETFKLIKSKIGRFLNKNKNPDARSEEVSRFYNIRGNLISMFQAVDATNPAEQERLRNDFKKELERMITANGTFSNEYREATISYLEDIFKDISDKTKTDIDSEKEKRAFAGGNLNENERNKSLGESFWRGLRRTGINSVAIYGGAAILSGFCPPAGMALSAWLGWGAVVGIGTVGTNTYFHKDAAINKDLERTKENPVAGIEMLNKMLNFVGTMPETTDDEKINKIKSWARIHYNYNYVLSNIGSFKLAPASIMMMKNITDKINTSPFKEGDETKVVDEAQINKVLDDTAKTIAGADTSKYVDLKNNITTDADAIKTNLFKQAQDQENNSVDEAGRVSKRKNISGSILTGAFAGIAIGGTAINMAIHNNIVASNTLNGGTNIGYNLGKNAVSTPSNNFWQGINERLLHTQHAGLLQSSSNTPFNYGPEIKLYESVQTAVSDKIKESVISESGPLNGLRYLWSDLAAHSYAGGFSKELLAQGIGSKSGTLTLNLGNKPITLTGLNTLTNSQFSILSTAINNPQAQQILANSIQAGHSVGWTINTVIAPMIAGIAPALAHNITGAGRKAFEDVGISGFNKIEPGVDTLEKKYKDELNKVEPVLEKLDTLVAETEFKEVKSELEKVKKIEEETKKKYEDLVKARESGEEGAIDAAKTELETKVKELEAAIVELKTKVEGAKKKVKEEKGKLTDTSSDDEKAKVTKSETVLKGLEAVLGGLDGLVEKYNKELEKPAVAVTPVVVSAPSATTPTKPKSTTVNTDTKSILQSFDEAKKELQKLKNINLADSQRAIAAIDEAIKASTELDESFKDLITCAHDNTSTQAEVGAAIKKVTEANNKLDANIKTAKKSLKTARQSIKRQVKKARDAANSAKYDFSMAETKANDFENNLKEKQTAVNEASLRLTATQPANTEGLSKNSKFLLEAKADLTTAQSEFDLAKQDKDKLEIENDQLQNIYLELNKDAESLRSILEASEKALTAVTPKKNIRTKINNLLSGATAFAKRISTTKTSSSTAPAPADAPLIHGGGSAPTPTVSPITPPSSDLAPTVVVNTNPRITYPQKIQEAIKSNNPENLELPALVSNIKNGMDFFKNNDTEIQELFTDYSELKTLQQELNSLFEHLYSGTLERQVNEQAHGNINYLNNTIKSCEALVQKILVSLQENIDKTDTLSGEDRNTAFEKIEKETDYIKLFILVFEEFKAIQKIYQLELQEKEQVLENIRTLFSRGK